MKKITPVILAGGSGTRLWPLSRTQFPKQFLTLGLGEHTLLQSTVLRLNGLAYNRPIVICNTEHRFLVAEQMRAIGVEATIILEPTGKNTAPAIALAALYLTQQNNDDLMLILSADHVINPVNLFHDSIKQAIELADDNYLVTFGVVPTYAHTGYGYIKKGDKIKNGYHINQFVEKPNQQTAQNYLYSGMFLWNSGMFLFKPSQYINELKTYAQDILQHCQNAIQTIHVDLDFIRIDNESFEKCQSESIDYAVMEKTTYSAVVPLTAQWNDVGSWSALWDMQPKDSHKNVSIGDTLLIDSQNNYCYSQSRLVALLGVEDLVVVETKDAVLVAHKNQTQDIKKIVEHLKNEQRNEHFEHREVYRPWGKYDSIDRAKRYQVKRITVNPNQKLSIQMHHHRSEHWIVVSGTARIHKGKESFLLTENESVYIPLGEIHSLENPGKLPLEIIEVQSGSYLGEDDIVRFEDNYGRA